MQRFNDNVTDAFVFNCVFHRGGVQKLPFLWEKGVNKGRVCLKKIIFIFVYFSFL